MAQPQPGALSDVIGVPETREEWARLLARRIRQSGLSGARYAREVLLRHPRTLRRWRGLDAPIPREVRAFLLDPKSGGYPSASALVGGS